MELLTEHEHVCPECGTPHTSLFRGTSALCQACVEQRQSAFSGSRAGAERQAEWQQARLTPGWNCARKITGTNWRDHPELSPLPLAGEYWWLRNDERDALVDAEGLPVFGTPVGAGPVWAFGSRQDAGPYMRS